MRLFSGGTDVMTVSETVGSLRQEPKEHFAIDRCHNRVATVRPVKRAGSDRWNYLKTRILIFSGRSGRSSSFFCPSRWLVLHSLAVKGGPRYGIEFKGGMMMTVKFRIGAPPLEEIRSALDKALANPPSVQTFENQSERS